MHNEIFIHTDRGQYIGGDIIYGTVYLNVVHPFTAKSLFLELKGYEKGTDYIHIRLVKFTYDNSILGIPSY